MNRDIRSMAAMRVCGFGLGMNVGLVKKNSSDDQTRPEAIVPANRRNRQKAAWASA
jgi:hypothetical protein